MDVKKITELLKYRYPAKEGWARFQEMSTATGANYSRRIDFYAFNYWPSKDFLRVAVEIKVSRDDFSKEMANPRKRQPAEKLANECYFAAPTGMVKVQELPENWGLLEMTKGGLRKKQGARQRHIDPPSIEFVAAIMSRSTDKPSTLSVATWLLAGQELTEHQLREASQSNIDDYVERKVERAVTDYKLSDYHVRLEQIKNAVGYDLGREYTKDIEKLREVLVGLCSPKGAVSNQSLDELGRIRRDLATLERDLRGGM